MARGDRVPVDVRTRLLGGTGGGRTFGQVSADGSAWSSSGADPYASGAAGLEPGAGGLPGYGPPLAQLVERSPIEFPPPGAVVFNASGNVVVTLANSPQRPAGLVTEIPAGMVAVIRSLTLNINSMATTTVVTADLEVNRAAQAGWKGLTIFPRNAASVSKSWETDTTAILVPEAGKIELALRIADGGSYLVGGTYYGWMFSQAVAERYGLSALF